MPRAVVGGGGGGGVRSACRALVLRASVAGCQALAARLLFAVGWVRGAGRSGGAAAAAAAAVAAVRGCGSARAGGGARVAGWASGGQA